MNKDLNEILTWQQNFGLLPIRLCPNTPEDDSYIMLNGGHGDFCLKTSLGDAEYDFNSLAWSSNTKNFLSISNDNVRIYNWKTSKSEEIPKARVVSNFDRFYDYLISNSYKSEQDVVPFIIDVFKQFRNRTQERDNPIEALNLLFLLLASIDDEIENLDFEKWGLNQIVLPNSFEQYSEKLKNRADGITPKLDLILRHSSGILFQEAQKEVSYFDSQMDLWGGYSNRLETKKNLYSSIHYTPPFLARTIVEKSLQSLDLSKPTLKILDPSCGSGEFLVESLKQLKEKEYLGTVTIIGWDTSQTAINTSGFLLNYEKRTIWANRLIFNVNVVDDSLAQNWDDDYDLILMNPPFVSWEQMDRNSRDTVKATLPTNTISKPNQASAFFYKTILCLNEGGVIGCVIPSSLLIFNSYSHLRKDIYGIIDIILIGKLGNFVFEDALTDVSMIVGQKPKTNKLPTILWTRNEKGIIQEALRDLRKMHYLQDFKIVEKDYSIYTPSNFPINKQNWKTISYQESELLKKIQRFVSDDRLKRVGDIFDVKQGIRLGNPAFKISENEFIELPANEKQYFRPAIDNESVKEGKIILKNFVWYPYDETGLSIKSEDELTNFAPYFYNQKLLPKKDELSTRARKGLFDWWTLSEHRAWLRENNPRLVSTEFGRSNSFAFDLEGRFVVERGCGWIPKKDFQDLSDHYFYLAIFSSNFFDKLLSIYSKQLAGGNWFDLGKKYTDEIPIPDVRDVDVKNSIGYQKLVQIGQELATGNTYVKGLTDEFISMYFYPET